MTESMTTTGSPWVYLFSKFTSEALLFEALIIFTLIALYSAFWLLRKRKYGVVETQVPAGVVKYYLNELIVDAEQLRAQLFGLLSGGGIPATKLANLSLGTGATVAAAPALGATATAAAAGDPQAMAALEAKLTSQAKQIEAFIADKTRIEQELSTARAAKGGATAGDPGALAKLQEKIAQLEGKLAEYSVIEDDLANLKRLQQENAALRAQLSGKGITPAVPATGAEIPAQAETPAQAGTPVAETPPPAVAATPAPAVAATPPAATAPNATAAATATPSTATATAAGANAPAATTARTQTAPTQTAPAPAAAAPTPATPGAPGLGATVAQAQAGALGEAGFEGLVDQVEQSLQPQAKADPAATATESSTTPNPAATIEKSDADLVAEFEKMLNG